MNLPNLNRAIEIMERLRDDPSPPVRFDMGVWYCGTAACFAGHLAHAIGPPGGFSLMVLDGKNHLVFFKKDDYEYNGCWAIAMYLEVVYAVAETLCVEGAVKDLDHLLERLYELRNGGEIAYLNGILQSYPKKAGT